MGQDSAPRPYLSIVLTGRNDGYGGDFVKRFLASLQFNHRELSGRGVSHEFVLVEWAPVAGAPLLADLVEARCPPPVSAALRTVVVDAAYHEAMTLNPLLRFHEYLAKNVGVRRARGEYILVSNCDVILGRHILAQLERRSLEPQVVYRAPRRDLVAALDIEHLHWEALEDPANLARPGKQLRPPYFRGSTGDFIALDQMSFHRLRAFNEIYRLARVGVDANLLVLALSSGLTIVDIGGPVYHIDHEGSFQTLKAKYVAGESDAQHGHERWNFNSVVYRNRPQWGLSDAPEEPRGPRRTYLQFSWDAVPPLVDLSGVVLPARREDGSSSTSADA